MSLLEHNIVQKAMLQYQKLVDQLSSPSLTMEERTEKMREYASLEPLIRDSEQLRQLYHEEKDVREMQIQSEDPALLAWLDEEIERLQKGIRALEQSVHLHLLPKDEADEKNAILEIRPGTGGDEAALFASDLYRMYQGYVASQGWQIEILNRHITELGGLKEICVSVTGKGVFSHLKFESGVHRVQRTPETESGGRIHTSTATVAVLPAAESIDIHVDEKDLRIDVFRSSGPGGQSVNTTDSAVRITHLPSGLVVSQQDERSQHKNKAKAMTILYARLYDLERQKRESDRAAFRKNQVGQGDRSERIRTYNFPQNRITDHRIGFSSHDLENVLLGPGLKVFVDALRMASQEESMLEAE